MFQDAGKLVFCPFSCQNFTCYSISSKRAGSAPADQMKALFGARPGVRPRPNGSAQRQRLCEDDLGHLCLAKADELVASAAPWQPMVETFFVCFY